MPDDASEFAMRFADIRATPDTEGIPGIYRTAKRAGRRRNVRARTPPTLPWKPKPETDQ
jgi:hypothetical protein